jgi:3-hydroxyanthranilate 3,4-dioxygenase
MLPGKTPHSPQRPANTVGLVIELVRPNTVMDGFRWYCENCGNLLHEAHVHVSDIVKNLPPVMEAYYSNAELRTCKKCGNRMEPPNKVG